MIKPATLRSPQRMPPAPKRGQSSLHLPGLPRYHPANYPSTDASSSIGGAPSSALPPSSLRGPSLQPQRQLSEAQRQRYLYQREQPPYSLDASVAAGLTTAKPSSPRLHPLGSPGPVTPLELETVDGYLFAGAASSLTPDAKKQLVEKLIDQSQPQMVSRRSAEMSKSPSVLSPVSTPSR